MGKDWDGVYSGAIAPGEPALVLLTNRHLLPAAGRALDIACGLGANALLLARSGLQVEAWDSSAVAIKKLLSFAAQQGLSINAVIGDVIKLAEREQSWDVIVVSHFLDRSLCARLADMLNPDGLLFYQTFTMNGSSAQGPRNKDFLLTDNELLELFRSLKIRYFRDEGQTGDTSKGDRDKSFLVAQKPGKVST